MHGSKILVKQIDVAARDLDRSRAVAEDALEAEDVAAVRQERARERVAQHHGASNGFRCACPVGASRRTS